MPACRAWSAAVFEASKRNPGEPAGAPSGSPQGSKTVASYSGGTRRASPVEGSIGVNVSRGVVPPDRVAHAGSADRREVATAPRNRSRRGNRASSTSANVGLPDVLAVPGRCRLRLTDASSGVRGDRNPCSDVPS